MGQKAGISEYLIIGALLYNEIALEDVDSKFLSPIGVKIYRSIQELSKAGESWDLTGVSLYITEILKTDQSLLHAYLKDMSTCRSKNSRDIVEILHNRNALLAASNEIANQLNSGSLDITKPLSILDAPQKNHKLLSAGEILDKGEPEPPHGPNIMTLPGLSKITNGIFGIYLIGGPPNIGKSTLAGQIAVDLSREVDVIYYDIENPETVFLYRLVKTFGLEKARQMSRKLYIRNSLRTLGQDTKTIKPPAVLVTDSIQSTITGDTDAVQSKLANLIRRFETLKKRGYSIILVSEVPRTHYEQHPAMDMFKYSGALEYAADTAIGLEEQEFGSLGIYVVKNRHYETKGRVGSLVRDNNYWFKETMI